MQSTSNFNSLAHDSHLIKLAIFSHVSSEQFTSLAQPVLVGLDKYTVEFFLNLWPTMRHLVTYAILDFFVTSKLFCEINYTIIALVPKKANSSS